MKDFREQLYEGYVSNFKRDAAIKRPGALSSYFRWCESRICPHLDDLSRDARILELGCGAGYFLEFLKSKGFTALEGVDTSAQQVELAQERGSPVQAADVFEFLQGKRQEYDVLVALDFVEHFHRHELVELAGLFSEALKPGGKLILQTPNGAGLFPWQVVYGDLTHLTIFTPQSLEQLLRAFDFSGFLFTETVRAPVTAKDRLKLLVWHVLKKLMMAIRSIETSRRQEVWSQNFICSCRKGHSPTPSDG